MRRFSQLHPAVNLVFFVLVFLITMLQLHPAFLAVSGLWAGLSLAALGGKASLGWRTLVGLMLLIALGNALLNPAGETVLFTYLGGRTFTLESLAWGGSAAVLFGSVVTWFACFHKVMTGEKLMHLFGRFTPTLALLFCMILRLVPEFSRQLRTLSQTRSSLGLGMEQCATLTQKIQLCVHPAGRFSVPGVGAGGGYGQLHAQPRLRPARAEQLHCLPDGRVQRGAAGGHGGAGRPDLGELGAGCWGDPLFSRYRLDRRTLAVGGRGCGMPAHGGAGGFKWQEKR